MLAPVSLGYASVIGSGLALLNTEKTIRRQILLIALIGGISFLLYLFVTIRLNGQNERSVSEMNERQLPAMRQVNTLMVDMGNIHEILTNAVALEDEFMLEEAELLQRSISESLSSLMVRQLPPHVVTDEQMRATHAGFQRYYQQAAVLAQNLINQPATIETEQERAKAINNHHLSLLAALETLQKGLNAHYRQTVSDTHANIILSARIGFVMGAITIVLLLVTTVVVMKRVSRVIRASEKMKDEFLLSVSHELRTPMHGIGGALEMMKSDNSGDEEILKAANSAYFDMMERINEVLLFQDIQSHNLQLYKDDFLLADIVSSIKEAHSDNANAKRIGFNVNFNAGHYFSYNGDMEKVYFIVDQLVKNAINFTRTGEVNLLIEARDRGIMICVSDTGPGIPKQFQDDIFEPFKQFQDSFSRMQTGVGIGLCIVKALVEAMNGTIEYSGVENGTGSVFTAHLQLAGVTNSRNALEPRDKQLHEGMGHRILVVEDNHVNRVILCGLLHKLGHQTICANDGIEALEMLEHVDVDLVLMDCQMPRMDGFEATRQIRLKGGRIGKLPIVAVTANARSADRDRCFDVGMDDFLAKPVNKEQLKHKLALFVG